MPQSHISKIESGQVDVRASSLIEIARAVDLELKLVPRSLVPTIEALSRPPIDDRAGITGAATTTIQEAHRALKGIEKDASRISRMLGAAPEITRLAETARELNEMPITPSQAEQILQLTRSIAISKNVLKGLSAANHNVSEIHKRADVGKLLKEATQANNIFRGFRNALAHGATSPKVGSIPAYRLTRGDDDDA